MEQLKKYFPLSFGLEDIKKLVIAVVIYLVIDLLCGVACKILSIIPLLGGIAAWVLGTLVGIYTTLGIVLAVVSFLKVIK